LHADKLNSFWSKVFASRKLLEFSGVKKTSGFLNREKAGLVRFSVLALLLVACVGGATADKSYTYPGAGESSADMIDGGKSGWAGMPITPSGSSIELKYVDLYNEIEGDTVVLVNQDTNTVLHEITAGSDIADFPDTVLESGTTYLVLYDVGGQNNGDLYHYSTTQDYPYGNSDFDTNTRMYQCNKDGSGCSTYNGNNYIYVFHTLNYIANQAPQFNSSSVSPDPPLIGENVSYGAEVFDSGGSIDYTNLTVEYGGSTVVSDAQRSGSTTPEWNDIYTPSSGDKWLNATFEVVDDAGATTTTEINRYLSDDAPSVTLNDPGNQTYYKYGVPLSVSVSDSDSEPNEDWSCTVDKDGSQVDSFNLKEGTNSSYSSTVSSDLGTHSVDVSCSDGSGNTDTASKSYTVRAYELQSVYGADPVYETENRTFDADLKTGSMVNSVDFSLNYDGSTVDAESLSSTGVETLRPDLRHEVPLVDSNQTSKNWDISFDVNKTDFQSSSTSILSDSSSSQSQEVLWSYWIQNANTNPANGKYIETENFKHEVKIGTETKKAEISGTTQYSRNSETDQMMVTQNTTDSTSLQGNIDVGKAENFNQSSFQTSSDIKIMFNGDSRTLSTGQDNVEVYRIQLFDEANPGSLSTSEALNFDVQYEETNKEVNTRFTMDLSVWKNRDEKIRRFNFQNDPASEHSFHIYPEWASYNIRTLTYPDETKFDLIQYWNDDKDYVRRSYFFPQTQTINNQTTTIPLRTINRTESTRIDFELLTSEGNPAENVYCRVDRKFGGGDFSTVFMIKTGSQGRGQSFAEVNEIYYSFTCYKNGEVVETFPSQIMQNPMVLTLGQTQVETVLDYKDSFDASCTSNETRITCDYQSQSEKMSEARLTLERLEPVNNMQVCSKTSETITGELACNQLNTTENDYRYTVTGEYPGSSIVGASGSTGATNSGMGAGGLILTMFIFLFTYAATSFNVPLGIGVGTISLLLSSSVGLWVLTPTMRATLIAVALIAGLVTRR